MRSTCRATALINSQLLVQNWPTFLSSLSMWKTGWASRELGRHNEPQRCQVVPSWSSRPLLLESFSSAQSRCCTGGSGSELDLVLQHGNQLERTPFGELEVAASSNRRARCSGILRASARNGHRNHLLAVAERGRRSLDFVLRVAKICEFAHTRTYLSFLSIFMFSPRFPRRSRATSKMALGQFGRSSDRVGDSECGLSWNSIARRLGDGSARKSAKLCRVLSLPSRRAASIWRATLAAGQLEAG